MARILTFTEDQVMSRGDDPNTGFKRGDVVEVVEDWEEFGKFFDRNPKFRIIEMPGVPAARQKYLVSEETETFPDPLSGRETTRTVRPRLFTLNLDALEAKEPVAGGERLTTIVETDLAPTEKTPLPEQPEIIGGGS